MDAREFFYEFGRALYHIDAYYGEFAKHSGVSPALLWVLYALNDGKSHTQIEISNDWDLPKTTVNTIVKELQQKAYVELVAIKGKRREMTIELTVSGKKYANDLLSKLYEKENDVYHDLQLDKYEIITLLEKIALKLKEDK